jgi:NAD(P)-dependent dehydrogenase (short-subunit alcohol dehydrogenase family)
MREFSIVFGENGAMESHLDLRGRVCLVTGGAKGIGRAVAERFIEAGAKVAIADIQMDGPPNENGSGSWSKISPFHCDVSDPGSVQTMVKDVIERFGRIDVLVNNAGVVGRCAPTNGFQL